uniref:SprT-like domain-containing protein n=2 Tax=Steinernema glaseri TaxID=37863 RepID=A0A1I7YHV8_9BILA
MIHAYLFITERNQDRDGHGPNFQAHMHRINHETGTAISIYHSFHAEVALYKQHHWRCEGPCRNKHPFYGWVKRATNRAPGSYDRWWSQHEATCGGKFVKVKEPEKAPKRKGAEEGSDKSKAKKPNPTGQQEITKWFGGPSSSTSGSLPSTSAKPFGAGGLSSQPSTSKVTGNVTQHNPSGRNKVEKPHSTDSSVTKKWTDSSGKLGGSSSGPAQRPSSSTTVVPPQSKWKAPNGSPTKTGTTQKPDSSLSHSDSDLEKAISASLADSQKPAYSIPSIDCSDDLDLAIALSLSQPSKANPVTVMKGLLRMFSNRSTFLV